MKPILFYEYETKNCNDLNIKDYQKNFLKSLSESLVPNKSIFTYTSDTISATSIVGMISFDNVQIEILPKLLRRRGEGDGNCIIKNLMFMLSYTNQLEISDSSISSMAKNFDSFLEAYISIFANRLAKQLRKYGSPKAYTEEESNLDTLKGKIIFPKHLAQNSFNHSKIFCGYSEFTANNPTSKAFKFVVSNLLKATRNSANQTVLNQCFALLDGVSIEYVRPELLDHVPNAKRDPNFLALLNLTKMFLRKMRPDFSGNRNEKVFSLLFDMNELFEEFIYAVIKNGNFNVQAEAQKQKRLVEKVRSIGEEWENKSLFDTFTDITVTPVDTKRPFIIDTKYKIVSGYRDGMKNPDVYQVLAYKQIHSKQDKIPPVILLYPKDFEDIRREYKVTDSDATFFAWTIDISRDLQRDFQDFKDELQNFLNHFSSVA